MAGSHSPGQICLSGTLDVPPLLSYGAAMVVHAGRHRFGPGNGRILLRTARDGLAAQAGHDLTIEAARWSGELTVHEDLSPASLSVQVDLGSLTVREGTGGLKPLTDADRRDLSPLFWTHLNPYGRFELDMNSHLDLAVVA